MRTKSEPPHVRCYQEKEAAKLLATIARTVHYAHQRGILHRDLKPGNILIDAQGQPHVTDFGLAKRVETDSSLTASGAILGTPCYMAPEQAAGAKALTTAADIYSLGAIFYELQTGQPPFHGATVMETFQKVMNDEPDSPRNLNRSVPEDLAAVCLKCLNKTPEGRYASAMDLAEDLERYLGGEPTHARSAGRMERLWRWCRRKPAVAALIALVFAAVIVGGTALGLWVRQTRTHADQQREAAGILASLLQGLGPQIAMARNSTETQRILVDATARINREFSDQPDTKANLLVTVGDTWEAIGEFARAEAVFRKALAVREQSLGKENLVTVEVMERIGVNQRKSGQLELSEATLRESLALKRKLHTPPASEIEALHQLGVTLTQRRNFVEAEGLLREVLRNRTTAPGQSPGATAATGYYLGHVLSQTARMSEADSLLQSALDLQRRTFGDLHPEVAKTLRELARIRNDQNRWPEAEAYLAEALRIQRALLGADHGETLSTEWHLATLARDQGRVSEAERAYIQLLPRMELTRGAHHFVTLLLRSSLARLQEYQGKDTAALTHWLHLLSADFEPDQLIRGIEGLLAPQTFTPLLCAMPDAPLIWRFTTNSPPTDWKRPGFSDLDWPQAPAPFGSSDTAATTFWASSHLRMRTEFTCRLDARQVIIRARHDDTVSVWINGVLAATNSMWSFGSHWLYALPDTARRSLKATNTLAVEVVNRDQGAHANVELYIVKDDAKAPLRQLVAELSNRIHQRSEDVGWLRARGRVRLYLGEGLEAAADFKNALLLLNRGVGTNLLAAARLQGLEGEAELLAARRNGAKNDAAESRTGVERAIELLRESRTRLAHLISTNDWQHADVSGLLGAALTVQAKLQPQSVALLPEAGALLHSAWTVLDQTSRFPDVLRQQRRERLAGDLAAFYELKATLDGDPKYQLEAERWRGGSGNAAR